MALLREPAIRYDGDLSRLRVPHHVAAFAVSVLLPMRIADRNETVHEVLHESGDVIDVYRRREHDEVRGDHFFEKLVHIVALGAFSRRIQPARVAGRARTYLLLREEDVLRLGSRRARPREESVHHDVRVPAPRLGASVESRYLHRTVPFLRPAHFAKEKCI